MNIKNLIITIKGLLFIGITVLVLTTFIYYYNGHISFSDIDPVLLSSYGTFIGGLTGTVFSLVAILLVWVTYTTQKKQIDLTSELQRKQRFEDTFFNMLQVQQEIKHSIVFDTSKYITSDESTTIEKEKITGEEVFDFAKNDFERLYHYHKGLEYPKIICTITEDELFEDLFSKEETKPKLPEYDGLIEDSSELIKFIKDRYRKFFNVYHQQFGHYFRHLYYILCFIEQNEIEECKEVANKQNNLTKKDIENKYQFYAGIVQAQMSSAELFLLFYNGIGFEKMKAKIEKYKLVENLCKEDLVNCERHKSLYDGIKLKSRYDIIN
jgi:hypothetical protein